MNKNLFSLTLTHVAIAGLISVLVNGQERLGEIDQPIPPHQVGPVQAPPPPVLKDRIEHLRWAIWHLRAAGANDLADRVSAHMEGLQRILDRAPSKTQLGKAEGEDRAMEAVHDLHWRFQHVESQLKDLEKRTKRLEEVIKGTGKGWEKVVERLERLEQRLRKGAEEKESGVGDVEEEKEETHVEKKHKPIRERGPSGIRAKAGKEERMSKKVAEVGEKNELRGEDHEESGEEGHEK